MPRLVALLALAVVACSPAATTPIATAPTPAAATPAVAPSPTAAAEDWQLLDAGVDGVVGISLRRAERELLGGRPPLREVVVAVIDGGVDTAHVDLKPVLWSNPKEQAGNGRDDDGNGYIDDTRGWSFLGGATGDVNWDTLELTRQHAACLALPTSGVADSTRTRCATLATEFATKRSELQAQSAQVKSVGELMTRTTRILRGVFGSDSLTAARVDALVPSNDSVATARSMYLRLSKAGITAEAVADANEQIEDQLTYGYNTSFDPRNIVGDNPADLTERRYGNRNVMGPNAKHGSHVAGIIAAARNGTGIDGVASGVRIMALRAVPDGDERDKDVAAAIRYAADNGAQIINMSFGKGLSPHKAIVDDAVRYAVSKGLLLVHAAGNDGADLATESNFPNPAYVAGGRAETWIEVGASSWKGGSQLAAPFSNYGKDQVDVFAPGQAINSTVSGGGYSRQDGTSMAAPVVSGLAALLMGHFPSLTAAQVKRIILESATSYKDVMVTRPGSQDEKVPFGTLSRTGGIVNAWAAVRAAQAMVRPVP